MPITYTPLQASSNPQTAADQGLALATGGLKGGSGVTTAAPTAVAASALPPATPMVVPGVSGSTATPGAPASPAAPAAPASAPGGSESGNDAYLLGGSDGAVNFELNPTDVGSLEDQEYAKGVQEAQPSIQAADDAYNAEISQQEDVGKTEESATGAALVAAGLGGSTQAAPALGQTGKATAEQVSSLVAQRGQAVQSILDNVRATAQTNSRSDAQNSIATVKALGQNYVSLQEFKSAFPDEYSSVLKSFGGDENALIASGAITAPKVLSSYVQGSNYVQTVQDPVTGKVIAQTFALSVTPPTGWSSEKLTNAIVFTDPSNAANSITYTTDPLTGALTVNGTGTGLQTLNAAGVGSASTQTGNGASSTGATDASTTVASILGVQDPTVPLSSVLSSNGVGSIVGAIIQNEGGSPSGVENNPGNIKFAGLPGQSDSGVKASDGGTFASYQSQTAGQQAIASIVNEASASGASLQDFVNKYTGSIDPASSTVNPATGLDTAQYGLLANVPGFDPTSKGDQGVIDSDAYSYLKLYMSGTQPTNTNLTGKRSSSTNEFQQAQTRAQDLYFKATGKQLPNITTLSSNLGFINANNSLQNSLNVQEQTISSNSALLQANMTADGVNANAPAINGILDEWKSLTGDPGVASYLAQNSTLSNELGSLLALKNASGTTVHDKLISADLIDKDATPEQEASVVNTLMKEAGNARRAIGSASATLYQQTDPLGLDPNNPINAPGYQNAVAIGFTPNYDGTYTSPDGSETVDASGNPVK